MAEAAVYALLSADAGVTALTNRIYHDPAPLGVAAPFITFFRVTSTRRANLTGPLGAASPVIQVDCCAATAAGAAALADAVRGALDGYAGTSGGVVVTHARLMEDRSFYEDGPVPLYRRSADYLIQHRES